MAIKYPKSHLKAPFPVTGIEFHTRYRIFVSSPCHREKFFDFLAPLRLGERNYSTRNLKLVRVEYSSPGRNTVEGNSGLLGESG
jgi:hypothetical protein